VNRVSKADLKIVIGIDLDFSDVFWSKNSKFM